MFLFYLEIVNKMRQVSITISEFTHSIKQSCERWDIKLYDSLQSSVQILLSLYWKTWKNIFKACKLLKSLSKKALGSSKEILVIYCFSLPDEGGETKIYQFLSFSVYFWLRQGGLSLYGSHKGGESAYTDLMFQFCLPSKKLRRLSLFRIMELKAMK